MAISNRRFDLDWLRFIAFALLILYHVGMFYVTWGWHVKSHYVSPAAEPVMLQLNPWRLALLFFISGVAVRFAVDKAASRAEFALSRILRLGAPIVFGMAILVMPQSYFELLQSGEISVSIAAFYPDYLSTTQKFSIITPTWNHLWYIVYLLAYILIVIPLFPWIRIFCDSAILRRALSSPWFVLMAVILPFVAVELWLTPRFPTTHALIGDWANHAHRFLVFMLGIVVAKHTGFWKTVDKLLPVVVFVVIATLLFRLYQSDLYNALSGQISAAWLAPAFVYLNILYAWTCILLLLGLAQRYLNTDSPLLRYLTGAVFCYYVVHQTLIVVAGYYLTQLRLGAINEFLLLTAITIVGCVLSFELLRRVPIVRVFFGIQKPSGIPKAKTNIIEAAR
jgi:hypothetical protein